MTTFSFMPMLCNTIDVLPEETGDFVGEIKWDGWRAIATIDENTFIETRSKNKISSLPYLVKELKSVFPSGTVIDGEIVDCDTVTHSWNRVQTLCSSQTIHIPSSESSALKYMVFDILYHKGEDIRSLPLYERRNILETYVEELNTTNVLLNDIFTPEKDWFNDIISKGHEGIVLKRKNSPYSGGRSGAWSKLKPQHNDSEEAEIIGLPLDGKGKYKGLVGGIEFKLPSGITGRCSGFSDDMRIELTNKPEEYVGKIIEVAHWGILEDNSLRHPQFRRIRLDREVEEMNKTAPKPKKVRSVKTKNSPPKMRNYKAMGDKKLVACLESFKTQKGDAYDRCTNGGSGTPEKDLEIIQKVIAERGL